MNSICNGIIADDESRNKWVYVASGKYQVEYKSTAVRRLDNCILFRIGLCTLKKMLLMGRKYQNLEKVEKNNKNRPFLHNFEKHLS